MFSTNINKGDRKEGLVGRAFEPTETFDEQKKKNVELHVLHILC